MAVDPGPEPRTRYVCVEHAKERISELNDVWRRDRLPPGVRLDEGVEAVVRLLNRMLGVRTTCSCSGIHEGAVSPYVTIAPARPEEAEAFQAAVRELGLAISRSPDAACFRLLDLHAGTVQLTIESTDRARIEQLWRVLEGILRTVVG
jgi:hypothetical protein